MHASNILLKKSRGLPQLLKNPFGRSGISAASQHVFLKIIFFCITCGASARAAEVSFKVRECVYAWDAKYNKTGTSVAVRIQLKPDSGVSAESLNTLKETWKKGIVDKWSDKLTCPNGASKMKFDVMFVDSAAHHEVRVRVGPQRSSMLLWDDKDDGHAASHEFGHMLGMHDEYEDASCPDRSPVKTGSVMDANTGAVAQNHITAVCESRASLLQLVTKDTEQETQTASEDPKVLYTHQDLRNPISCSIHIAAGDPGDRFSLLVSIDESKGLTSIVYLDELKKGSFSKDYAVDKPKLEQLRRLLEGNTLPIRSILGGPLMPGSPVATVKIQIGEKSSIVSYPVGDIPPEGEPNKAAIGLLKEVKPETVPEIVKSIHELLVTESSRIPMN
ncbi:MAG: hypothetical protein V4819_21015 [Verrucomicrobiota bacterium]